ncbi:MAG TPA: long-chain fatty acid--CoA ligase [Pseudolabrys sp.]|nr:long-chain fatty acid--CoA ligase [Pseudolabrys sp.]
MTRLRRIDVDQPQVAAEALTNSIDGVYRWISIAMGRAITAQAVSAVPDADRITAGQARTLWGLFRERLRRSPHAVAYRDYDSAAARWRDHTWAMISDRVDRFRGALVREGVKAGDHVAILLPNGIDWVCLDLAAHALGLVVVGLYPHETAATNANILGHSDARLVLLDSVARWRSLSPLRAEFPCLKCVWINDTGEVTEIIGGPKLCNLAAILAIASGPPVQHPAAPGDVAALIYTSGTTGRPKGVMLSHFALLWNAQASAAVVPPRPDDVFLSILPLAHAFERTVGYYLPMTAGSTVAYARSAQDLPDDFLALRPTAMLGVPLLFERMAAAVRMKVARSWIRRQLLQITMAVGYRRFCAQQHRSKLPPEISLLWSVLNPLVARRVLAAFGGRLRVAISGGAPLEHNVSRMLIGLGLPLVEGYGLTEVAPVVAANGLDDNLPGSVGRPLHGVEIKLAAQGELLVRSPAIMAGYWKDERRTQQSLDPDGWLSTGDIAELNGEGRVFIRGRLADVIVLSIGEKVNPNLVEAELCRDPLFEQAVAVGNRRPFLAAVIVLNAQTWDLFAAKRGLNSEQPNHPASKIELLAKIASLLAKLPRYAQVRAVHLTLQPWTIKAGLLTPTLKVKREFVIPLFAKEIDALYAKYAKQ